MSRRCLVGLLVSFMVYVSMAAGQEYTFDWKHPSESGTVKVRLEHFTEYGHSYSRLSREFVGPIHRTEILVFDTKSLLPIRAEMLYQIRGLTAKKTASFHRNALLMEWRKPELMGGEIEQRELALPENTYALQCLPLLLQENAGSTTDWQLNLVNPLARNVDETVGLYEIHRVEAENGISVYNVHSVGTGVSWQIRLDGTRAYPLLSASCVFTDLGGTLVLK